MNKHIKIADRKIGLDYPPLIIVEIGINHNGELSIAKELIDAAYESGAEVIKHQTHIVEDEMSSEAKKTIPGNTTESIYEIMEQCALNEDDEFELMRYVESKGMIFISTPFSREAADRLEKFNVKAYKIGSGECNNYPLIEHICSFGKPIILSTGMNNIETIQPSVNLMEKYNIPYVLLHCTNIYPTPPNLVRLGGMQELQKHFPNAIIGLSDHTVNNNACLAATSLGACVLERHFVDYKSRIGPDILCSMDKNELKDLIISSTEISQMRGGSKEPAKEEQVTMDFAFATAVAIKDIKIGDILTEKNIWVKRPGTGEIFAKDYHKILGKKALLDIKNDQHLKYSDII